MIEKLNALKKEKQTRLKQLLKETLPENLEKYKNPEKLETTVLHHISKSKKKYKGKTYTIYELTVYDPEEKKVIKLASRQSTKGKRLIERLYRAIKEYQEIKIAVKICKKLEKIKK